MALVEGTNCGFVATAPTSDPEGTGTIFIEGAANAMKFVSPVGATKVIEMGYYQPSNSFQTRDSQFGIYSHNAGDNNPEDLLGSSGDVSMDTTLGWKVSGVLDIAITGETIYWVAIQHDSEIVGRQVDFRADGAYKRDLKTSQTSLPDPWGTTSGTAGHLMAIYAVYEVAAAGNLHMMGANF